MENQQKSSRSKTKPRIQQQQELVTKKSRNTNIKNEQAFLTQTSQDSYYKKQEKTPDNQNSMRESKSSQVVYKSQNTVRNKANEQYNRYKNREQKVKNQQVLQTQKQNIQESQSKQSKQARNIDYSIEKPEKIWVKEKDKHKSSIRHKDKDESILQTKRSSLSNRSVIRDQKNTPKAKPQQKQEIGKEEILYISNDNKTIRVSDLTHYLESTYQYVFDPRSRQKDVFDKSVRECVDSVIQGYNSTIFAYGQTGSGKTYTIFGDGFQSSMLQQIIQRANMRQSLNKQALGDLENSPEMTGLQKLKKSRFGIIPRTITYIFKQIQKKQLKCTVYLSFLQIYNEQVFDMLSEFSRKSKKSSTEKPLKIREDKLQGVYVEDLSEYIVTSKQQCFDLLIKGEKIRAKRVTKMNIHSSRSHSLFQILIESDVADEKGMLQRAKLNIGDLAGSEKICLEEFPDSKHLNELKNINLSLTYLGKVISMLANNKKQQDEDFHVPFRNSKLTRLLQDSLGGNTRTCLIANVSPIIDHIEETISSLKFADRAKRVQMKISKNEINAQDDALVCKLQKEISYLKELLKMRRKGDQVNIQQQVYQLKEENERLRAIAMSVSDVEKLKQENKEMRIHLQGLVEQQEQEKIVERKGQPFTYENIDEDEISSTIFVTNQRDSSMLRKKDGKKFAQRIHQKDDTIDYEKNSRLEDSQIIKNEVFINNALLFSFDNQSSRDLISQKFNEKQHQSNQGFVANSFWEESEQFSKSPLTKNMKDKNIKFQTNRYNENESESTFDNYQVVQKNIKFSRNAQDIQHNNSNNLGQSQIFKNIRSLLNAQDSISLSPKHQYQSQAFNYVQQEQSILPQIGKSFVDQQRKQTSISISHNGEYPTIDSLKYKTSTNKDYMPRVFERLTSNNNIITQKKQSTIDQIQQAYQTQNKSQGYSNFIARKSSNQNQIVQKSSISPIQLSRNLNILKKQNASALQQTQDIDSSHHSQISNSQYRNRRNIVNLDQSNSLQESQERKQLALKQEQLYKKANQRLQMLEQLEQDRKAKFERELEALQYDYNKNLSKSSIETSGNSNYNRQNNDKNKQLLYGQDSLINLRNSISPIKSLNTNLKLYKQ